MPNTAKLARDLPPQARFDLLRVFTDPTSQRPPEPILTQRGLINVIDGRLSLSELGERVVRHLDAGHQVQLRGRLLRIVERVLAARAVDDDIERVFSQHFTPSELDQYAEALDQVCVALRRASEYAGVK